MIKLWKYTTLLCLLLAAWTPPAHAQNIAIKDGQKIVFLGDSITAMGMSSFGYARQVGRGLEANGIKVTIIGAGVGGNTSVNMLARMDSDVLAHKPDWMTLSCGVNDVYSNLPLDQFKDQITKIVAKAQSANIKVVILTATMIGENPADPKNQQLIPYNAFLRQLAKDKQCVLGDLNARMQAVVAATGGGQAQSKRGNVLTVEGIHMNALGNQVMALGVLEALGLNPAQLRKAQDSWLDLPGICEVSLKGGMTMRQYEQLDALATRQKRPTSEVIGELVSKALAGPPQRGMNNKADDNHNVRLTR
jgi:lysophospholipase L1-like esterase